MLGKNLPSSIKKEKGWPHPKEMTHIDISNVIKKFKVTTSYAKIKYRLYRIAYGAWIFTSSIFFTIIKF